MSELFDDEDKTLGEGVEEAFEDAEDVLLESKQRTSSNARRRLETLLEDKRLRDELKDYLDED